MKFKLKYYFKKVMNFIYADYYDFKCFYDSLCYKKKFLIDCVFLYI